MINEIIKHLNKYNLDIKKTRNARFIDQKVTPDVLCIIADCVIEFTKDSLNKKFTANDIWLSKYANENVKGIFNKPDVLNKKAKSEYDKFFAQPLKMLAYSQVIKCFKKGNRNIFKINNIELLRYISIKEKNSLEFLVLYLQKVLKDSDIWPQFNLFLNNNNADNFNKLKDLFKNFLYQYTSIKSSNKYEPGRIFTKIINPLAYNRKSKGTRGGYLSADIVGYDELMYNRKNWRDIKKLKVETRQEYEVRAKSEIINMEKAYIKFNIEKAIKLIKIRYHMMSEVKDKYSNGKATQVHHIFLQSEFPKIKAFLENLILLTGTQHSAKAHPDNNYRRIDKNYQLLCLISKITSIQESIKLKDGFYSKSDFVFVLNEGINPEVKFEKNIPLDSIKKKIIYEYNKC